MIPLILTLVNLALANPDYEEGCTNVTLLNLIYPIFADVFSVEDEGEYSDEDPDNRMGIIGMAKSGQNRAANVPCKRWTSRLVTVGNDGI